MEKKIRVVILFLFIMFLGILIWIMKDFFAFGIHGSPFLGFAIPFTAPLVILILALTIFVIIDLGFELIRDALKGKKN